MPLATSELPLSGRQVRALRAGSEAESKQRHESYSLHRPQAVTMELERRREQLVQSATLFLTGAECPYSCVFCDLWQYTLEGPTPAGAIPRQIEVGLAQVRDEAEGQSGRREGVKGSILKLYNASNFFDERAVPAVDDAEILRLLSDARRGGFADRVVVECHPGILNTERGRTRLRLYAESCELEVALGLETVAAGGLAALNKGCNLDDFERAFELCHMAKASVRTFVLFGVPLPSRSDEGEPARAQEQHAWTMDTVRWARDQGASCATLIPVRAGNGALEVLGHAGRFVPPTLGALDNVYRDALSLQSNSFDVHLDTWDMEAVARGDLSEAEADRVCQRLTEWNLKAPSRAGTNLKG